MTRDSRVEDAVQKRETGAATPFENAKVRGVENDDFRLAEMGYKPELDRKFSLLSCLAVGFSVSPSPLSMFPQRRGLN
jgi:hypothetical protein